MRKYLNALMAFELGKSIIWGFFRSQLQLWVVRLPRWIELIETYSKYWRTYLEHSCRRILDRNTRIRDWLHRHIIRDFFPEIALFLSGKKKQNAMLEEEEWVFFSSCMLCNTVNSIKDCPSQKTTKITSLYLNTLKCLWVVPFLLE